LYATALSITITISIVQLASVSML